MSSQNGIITASWCINALIWSLFCLNLHFKNFRNIQFDLLWIKTLYSIITTQWRKEQNRVKERGGKGHTWIYKSTGIGFIPRVTHTLSETNLNLTHSHTTCCRTARSGWRHRENGRDPHMLLSQSVFLLYFFKVSTLYFCSTADVWI